MNIDGSNSFVLLSTSIHTALAEYPLAWSPDGSRIAFYGYDHDPNFPTSALGLYLINSEGNALALLSVGNLQNPGSLPRVTSPTWSPDGTKIAFVRNDDGEIYVIELPLK